jgi:hypothetical protein
VASHTRNTHLQNFRSNGGRLGTALPFPPWRLQGGPILPAPWTERTPKIWFNNRGAQEIGRALEIETAVSNLIVAVQAVRGSGCAL